VDNATLKSIDINTIVSTTIYLSLTPPHSLLFFSEISRMDFKDARKRSSYSHVCGHIAIRA